MAGTGNVPDTIPESEPIIVMRITYKPGDRRAELKMSILIEYHHSDAGNRFRHGVDTKDRIRFGRFFIFNVLHADGFKIRIPFVIQ